MKKGILRSFAFVCVLLTVFTVLPVANAKAVDETEISPRYTGISKITAGLTINAGGYAHCLGEVRSNNGYSAILTVELQQDGTTIKSWTNSGEGLCSVDEGYNVAKGHSYQVIVTAEVKNSRGIVVETVTDCSKVQSF
ncbi:hypothetical protein [uncultured Oscillibacter sp.]|jgi:hypothetical protein|uniref:hypothetical protein n=1 Tax=uncultured Oscillibacter sp. TaxID=876091 RepID=UPI00272E1FFD|nr:hypothetical protein [uncultured Oscillibacter sp.]